MNTAPVLYSEVEFPFLAGGGISGALIRSHNWEATPLGSPAHWPQSLRTCVRIILTSRQPMFVWWGRDLINIYNEAYIDIVGGKHPWAFGEKAQIVWNEIWEQVGPRAAACMDENRGTYDEALLLIMHRNGYPEETYYTFSYSPVPGDEGGTAGIICANTDDTQRIVGTRELSTLKDLGKALIDCKSDRDVFGVTMSVLQMNEYDFPFAFFLRGGDNDPSTYDVIHTGNCSQEPPALTVNGDSAFEKELREVRETRRASTVPTQMVKDWCGPVPIGAWSVEPNQTLISPVLLSGVYGFLVIGLNPYRQLDDRYGSFFQLVLDQVTTALSNVHNLAQEKRRAEALAEIDRAKTAFFSNISHEFRTPLTLMRSPLEEVMRVNMEFPPQVNENLNIAYRNTLRLQKLVNTLLDFSKIEAGRMQATYEPVNLSALTRDLASSFRSAIEKAGMKLIVNCEDLREPVFVDIDMWEKIVLNLLSNAFKYTKKGTVTVTLVENEDTATLSVADTGVGIPPGEKDRIFERFHRVQNTGGRSQEGTGIGLALVQELVRIQEGKIEVDSELGQGSTFTVTIPKHGKHTPLVALMPAATATARTSEYVEEASKWTRSEGFATTITASSNGVRKKNKPLILLCDDNADMRLYIARLLAQDYDVLEAENGRVGLKIMDTVRPDLVISDIMMPEMDGFGLMKAIKGNMNTIHVPVILLSARAGEDETAEGLATGADDYIVKPFTASTLLSRVGSLLRIAAIRRETEMQYNNLFMQAPMAFCTLEGPEFVIRLANQYILEIWGRTASAIGKPLLDVLPEIVTQGLPEILRDVRAKSEPFHGYEFPVRLNRFGAEELIYVNFVYHPIKDLSGEVSSILVIAYDVTVQLLAKRKIFDAEERLRLATENTGLATWDLNLVTSEIIYSPKLNELFGFPPHAKVTHQTLRSMIYEDDLSIVMQAQERAYKNGIYQYEARIKWTDDSLHWVRTHGRIIFDDGHRPARMLGTMLDISEARLREYALQRSEEQYRNLAINLDKIVNERTQELMDANESLERSNKELEQFAFITSHDLQEPLRKIQTFTHLLQDKFGDRFVDNEREYLRKVIYSAERMSNLIRDLLNFSRLSKVQDGFKPTDLYSIATSVRNDFELMIKQRGATVRIAHLPTIEANATQMQQLFYNLMGNALKFSSREDAPDIRITCRELTSGAEGPQEILGRDEPFCEIEVQDNGIGFSQEYAQKIFEIFQQLNNRSEFEGTGIGLAIVKKVVDNHRGFIKAESMPGKGATFHIFLPARHLAFAELPAD